MQALFTALAIPFIVVNMFGGIVGGVWLAFQGQWWTIGLGFLVMLIGTWPLMIAMMPGLLLAAPGMYFTSRNMPLAATFFVFLNSLYTNAVVTAWCLGVLYVFLMRYQYENSIIPTLLWAYAIAMGPLAYLGKGDGPNSGSAVTTMFAQFGYAAALIAGIFFGATMIDMAVVFFIVMGIFTLMMTRLSYDLARASAQQVL
jgi:hypothetical protein